MRNVINKFEEVSLVDPLEPMKSIEIGIYELHNDTIEKFNGLYERPPIV